jgi:hypothetical protein
VLAAAGESDLAVANRRFNAVLCQVARRAGASQQSSLCADLTLMGITLPKGGGLVW